jgi:gas vesicle protein
MSSERDSTVAREGSKGMNTLFAFLSGAAVGAITALLTAPASGAETRARLRARGQHERDRVRHLPAAFKAASVAAEEAFVSALKDPARKNAHNGARSATT